MAMQPNGQPAYAAPAADPASHPSPADKYTLKKASKKPPGLHLSTTQPLPLGTGDGN